MRGDFAKAFGVHRKNGGTLTRKEFAERIWPSLKNQDKEFVVETEVKKDDEA